VKPLMLRAQWVLSGLAAAAVSAAPRIESVEMLRPQPQAQAPTTIWYDDFNGAPAAYSESEGAVDRAEGFGGGGGALRCLYEAGQRGQGNRKVFFGDSPTGRVVRPGERFDTVYWRIYVKHQHGWTGSPAKMSRATSLVSGRWNQAMIAHVWSTGDFLTLDPASGVRGDQVVTTKYNDFEHLRWLGNKPVSTFPLHRSEESGWWVCVEAMARLNTPGEQDGETRLWIDGRPACARTGLDWMGGFTGPGINAVFLETYWNEGSPVTQSRWYDNFVISTEPIGPITAPLQPLLHRAPGGAPEEAWAVEVAEDGPAPKVVWRGGPYPGTTHQVRVSTPLRPGRQYAVRVRVHRAEPWSPWHQRFRVDGGGNQHSAHRPDAVRGPRSGPATRPG